jgi:hypothetical protein
MSSFFGNWFGKQQEAPPEAEGEEEASAPEEASANASDPPDAAIPLVKPAPPAERVVTPKPRYGIDDAIKLMRTLPIDDNVDLVVRVIKRTLESLNVRVPEIVEDAGRRQEALSTAITEHETSILKLEREIETRRNEIAHLQDELAETSTVRERLELAEQLQLTPASPRVSATPTAPVVVKKPATTPARSVPPVPPPKPDTSYRPKLSSADFKKGVTPAPAEPRPTADEDEMPVESRDFEKSP